MSEMVVRSMIVSYSDADETDGVTVTVPAVRLRGNNKLAHHASKQYDVAYGAPENGSDYAYVILKNVTVPAAAINSANTTVLSVDGVATSDAHNLGLAGVQLTPPGLGKVRP